MNKSILSQETRDLLHEHGVSKEEINKIYKETCYEILLNFTEDLFLKVKNREFDKIKLKFSPAGDGFGEDNDILDIEYFNDIGQVINILREEK